MVEHYTEKFDSLWQYSKTLEDLDYKDCCVFEKSFKFKLESFVRWICLEAHSDVCPPPKLKEYLKICKKQILTCAPWKKLKTCLAKFQP